MDERFRAIFREQAEFYRASQVSPAGLARLLWPRRSQRESRSVAIVGECLEAATVHLGPDRTLREDARVFLFTNLHQMVALPLAHSDSPTELTAQVEEGLRVDTQRIVAAATEQAGGRRELTASDVLRGTSAILDT